MSRKSRITAEEKIQIAQDCIEGRISQSKAARRVEVDESSVRAWIARYEAEGDVHCTSDGSKVTFDVEKNADFDTYLAAGGYQNYLEELAAQETESVDRTIPGEEDPDETEARVTYIANTNTKKFHYPDCSSVGQMKESNKWYFTGTRDELIELGYDPCGRCHP